MTHPPFYVAGSFAAHPMKKASWRQSTTNLEVGKSRRVSSVAPPRPPRLYQTRPCAEKNAPRINVRLDKVAPYQKRYFSANCNWRMSLAVPREGYPPVTLSPIFP